jgi:hypothetical protein
MRRLILILVALGLIFVGTMGPAAAFIHVTIPADNCADNAAVTPGDATTAPDDPELGGQTPPLGNVPGDSTDPAGNAVGNCKATKP